MNPLHLPLQRPPRLRAAILVAALLAAMHAFAAETDISQVPMSVKNTLSPNIMFTLDDSGSMYWETIPDAGLSHLFPRSKNPYGTVSDYDWATVDADPEDIYARFYRSAAGNPLFYNPAIRYEPWREPDGTSWPDAVPSKASMNPGMPDAPTLDLTAGVSGTAWRLYRGDAAPQNYKSNVALTFWPATYFVYKGTEPLALTGATNVKANFKHVEIKSGQSYDAYPERTDCGTDSCSYDAELKNFANWFSYHRSRLLAARAGIGKAFSMQKDNFRVGYATINSPSATIDGVSTGRVLRGVRPFSGDARQEFFDLLYSHPVGTEETPLVAAADDIGAYFSRSDTQSPWRKSMTDAGSIELSCFRNYHILMTDGYWTDGFPARSAINSSNVDDTAGPTHTHASGDKRCLGGGTYTYEPKHPFADTSTGTLADVAMYYWKNDLRSDLINNVPPDVPNDRSDCDTKTPDLSNDINPGFWQHLKTFTVGFGVEGTLSKDLIESAFTDKPGDFSWPAPTSSDAAKLDDLAHAAVNGHGRFFTTSKPAAFASELTTMLGRISADTTASAASAVSNPNVTLNDNITYETTYLPGQWTGDLKAFEIDVQSGAPDPTKPVWAVACPTDDDLGKVCDGAASLLDKRTASSRKIATYDGESGGIAFQAGIEGLDDALVAYLRGDRSCEQGTETAEECTTVYRSRTHLLGAIIHSEPFLAREPDRGYADTGYADFRADKAGRARMLYVGANDGMLHAFNAKTGEEEWAYVPRLVHPRLAGFASPSAAFQATVDGYIAVADVDFNNAHTTNSTNADWRTLLVGALGRGGKGIYALDVTDPTAADEAAVADKVLWEFPNKNTSAEVLNKLGVSFSRPIIVKHEVTKTDGTRAGLGWVVLISSGYNNGDGKGYLFLLDVETGAVLATLSTPEGSSASPSGLGQVSAWADNDNLNSAVRWVYGGDLNGNLWRFDLSTETGLDKREATKLATLTAPNGSAQAITTAPELTRIKSEGVYYNLVAVGTGRYLGDSDVPGSDTVSTSATQTQSFYVLVDTTGTTITRSKLTQRTLTTLSDGKRALTDPDPVDWSKTSGWYVDLNTSGERVVTDPAIAHTTVVFVSNVPNSNPCLPGTSHLFQFDLVSGSYVIGTSTVSERIGDTLATRPVLIKLPSGKIVALIRKSDGTTVAREVPIPTSGGSIRRLSWRELNYR